MRTLRLALAATGLATVALAAMPRPAAAAEGTCARDLLVAQSSQRVALDRLERTGDSDAERCRAWREHVATMRRAAAIYGRCLAGEARAAKLAEVEGPAREFDGLVKQRCGGR